MPPDSTRNGVVAKQTIIEKAPILKASQNPRKPKNIKPSGCPGESSKFANSDFTPPMDR